MTRLTLSDARALARENGMTIRKQDGEYRVAWPHDEASAYYTNSLRDALDTMHAMRAHRNA